MGVFSEVRDDELDLIQQKAGTRTRVQRDSIEVPNRRRTDR